MVGHGNGTPQRCIANLLQIDRGENPYERLKGRDTSLIGRPATELDELVIDTEWMLETYEPRAQQVGINLNTVAADTGLFGVDVEIVVAGQEV